MSARSAYVLCSDPQFQLRNVDQRSLALEYGDLGRDPSPAAEVWIICALFGAVDPLRCSEEQFEHGVASPLRFCIRAAREALLCPRAPKRIIVAGVTNTNSAATLAEPGAAALLCLARSLAIESAARSITVAGIGISAQDFSPITLLSSDTLPTGSCLDVRSKWYPDARPCTRTDHPGQLPARSIALVTGAARGLGRAIAERFLLRGDFVLLVDSNETALYETVRQLCVHDSRVAAFAADVSCRKQLVLAAEQALSLWGPLNVWVNNAGIAVRQAIENTQISEFDRVMNTNFKGTLWGSQIACEAMTEYGGVVLNMSSTASRTAGLVYSGCYNQYASYAASKAAIESLTRILPHVTPSGIRVTGIAPGPILTELTESLYAPAQRADLERHIPAARLGSVADIASAAAFLTSTEASFISGTVLTVDGGLSACAGGPG